MSAKKIFSLRNILIAVFVVIVLIQFVRIDKTAPQPDPQKDFIQISNLSPEAGQILKTSCYDCHSYETEYPWYSNIAPVSWMLKNHIDEGRKHLNFSEWGSYDLAKRENKTKEILEEIKDGEMPLSSYTLLHTDAKLSEEKINLLNMALSPSPEQNDSTSVETEGEEE